MQENESFSRPDPSDCCNSGCNPCILDVFEQQKPLNLKPEGNCLQPCSYSIFALTKRERHTETTIVLEFAYLKSKSGEISQFNVNFEPGQYFLLKHADCTRAYTPIFAGGQQFTILVRLYENGRMSRYLHGLKVGEETFWRGPYGDFVWDKDVRHLICIGQGVGVAPLFALTAHLLRDETCECFIKLLFCCRDPQDILLREFLYDFASNWNFTYEVFLGDAANVQRKYKEVVHEHKLDIGSLSRFGGKAQKSKKLVLIGGNDLFIDSIKSHLTQIGITNKEMFSF